MAETIRPTPSGDTDLYAALRLPEFWYWLAASTFSNLASRTLAVALCWAETDAVSKTASVWINRESLQAHSW